MMGSTETGQDSLSALFADLFQICQSVVDGDLTPHDAFDRIQIHQESCPHVCSALLDVLSVVEGEATGNEEATKRFAELLQLLMNTVIGEDVIRAELESLDAALPPNKSQIIRMKTKLFFKQTKFNLLREESEGYAKLLVECLSEGDDVAPTEVLIPRILSLIGTFNLDPNRVTDLILESFERCPSRKETFIALLKEQGASPTFLCTLLSFKFSFYHDKKTPLSLYRLTASLIEEGFIDLEEIASYLTPKAGDLMETHKARAALASVRSKKAETILTSSVASDPHKHSLSFNDTTEPSSITSIAFSAVTAQQESEDAKLKGTDDEESILGGNQKMGVACALLEDFAWPLGRKLLDCMPEFYAVQASKRTSCAIADMVDAAIDDLFHIKCAQGLSEYSSCTMETRPWEKKLSSWDDLDVIFELLHYLGPRLAYRPRTLTKLVRLITVFYEEKAAGAYGTGDDVSSRIMDVVDECLLPGLSLCDSNVALSEEMWTLLSSFSYQQRFRLYGRWKTLHTNRHPELLVEKGKTIGRTKYVIKRLSKETVKVMGRILGKLSHSHPAFVFDYLLTQIQSFDNLIHPVVDAFRFLTNLELDILLYCVLEQLASPSKNALKASDGTTSTWLSSLATFVGALLKKYTIELAAMLHYVAHQLMANKCTDLVILNEMIVFMAGVEKATQATAEHIEGMSGGELLRQEAGNYATSRNKRSTMRLNEAIVKDDLAVGLCILVSQQREHVIFDESDIPLKLKGELSDQCRETLVQFSSFLLENAKLEEYSRQMPNLISLLDDYHVPQDSAFYLSRPTFMHQVYADFEKIKKTMKVDVSTGEKTKLDSKQKGAFFNSAFGAVVHKLGEELKPRFVAMGNAEISMDTAVLCWMLQSYDLEVPVSAYEREMEKMRKAIGALPDNPELGRTRRAKEEERLKGMENKLKEEQRKQTDHVERIRAYLRAEKDNLFASALNVMQTLLQQCILPRAMFSEGDGIFAAKFVLLLHSQRTKNFQTLHFLDKLFSDILPVIALLTESEANAVGRFCQVLLSQCIQWHNDKELFERECEGYPGFQMRLKQTGKKGEEQTTGHETHGKLIFKWQNRLTKTFCGVLSNESADYVHIRNCLIFMTKMVSCFPVLIGQADQVETIVTTVKEREKGTRDDLSLKAASYIGQLRMRRFPPLYPPSHFFCKGTIKAKPVQKIVVKSIPSTIKEDKKEERKEEKIEEKKDKILEKEVKKEVKNELDSKVMENEEKLNGKPIEEPKKKVVEKEKEKERDKVKEKEKVSNGSGQTTVPPVKRKKETDGGLARVALLGIKKKSEMESVERERERGGVRNELDGMKAKKEVKVRMNGGDKEEGGTQKEKEEREEKKKNDEDEGRQKRDRRMITEEEEGEVPPSPPRKERREIKALSSDKKNGNDDRKREKRDKERGRDEEKEKKEERRRTIEGPMPPPKSTPKSETRESRDLRESRDSLKEERKDDKEKERREKRKTSPGEENSPSIKKTRKDKGERERERSIDGKGNRPSRSPRLSREKEERSKERERKEDRKDEKRRVKSPERERKSRHPRI